MLRMEEIVFIPLIPMRLHYFQLFANQIIKNFKGWRTGILGSGRVGLVRGYGLRMKYWNCIFTGGIARDKSKVRSLLEVEWRSLERRMPCN